MIKLYNLSLLAVLLLSSATLWSQKASKKNADALFAVKSYVEAAKMYEQLNPKDNQVLQNLADCYYYNAQIKLAVDNYSQLIIRYKDSVKPEVNFRYAHALKAMGTYDKADAIMSEYLKYPVDTQKFKDNLARIVPYNYKIQPMTKSFTTGDFGLALWGDKVVFASLRSTDKPSFNWNDKPYLDLYEGTINSQELLENIKAFPNEINTKTHESNATFTADGKVMYFSRTADKRVQVGNEKFASVKLFRAEWDGTLWTNIIELPFSSDQYSVVHPFITPDGKKLFFSSDMPGSLGSFDIYEVDVNDDGTFGTPSNLGPLINTNQREQFPFVDEDNTLYFASDGHQGLGGLDIFMSKNYDGQYAKSINLGETINSGFDDFGYLLKDKEHKGYLSSNRRGADNLYSFIREENPRQFSVEGDVRDKNSKLLLPGTQVTLYDEDNNLIGQMVVGANADYAFNTEPNKTYRLEAVRDFYIPHSEEFTTNDDGTIRYSIELVVESYDDAEEIVVTKDDGYVYIELENIYFDLDKWDIKPEAAVILDVLVHLLNKYPRMEIQLGAHTDSRASDAYNLRLSHNRAAATLEYLVENGINRKRLRSKGYGERVPLVNCGDNCTEVEHAINRRCEFLILK
jgi:peptidoglycan-associated lipoprotein